VLNSQRAGDLDIAVGAGPMAPTDWLTLLGSIRDRECIVFLGAGASTMPDGQIGLPTASALSNELAEECRYPGTDKSDFLRVCQFYELTMGGHRLRKQIIKKLNVPGVQPGRLHELIAALPIQNVLTTNYDGLMESAFQMVGKTPKVAVYDIDGRGSPADVSGDDNSPLVYKLHGSMEDPRTMLCTEDDIVQFLACILLGDPPLLANVRTLFRNHTILFVGYGLKDWNIRAMIRALRGSGKRRNDWIRSFALQRRFDTSAAAAADWQQSVLYWDRKENVHCLDLDVIGFFEDLVRRHHDSA
jgi:NAD-dependent SIR2 family protein deacetylase